MITVIVAAESHLLRQLLFEALNGQGGLSVAATASDARRAVALHRALEAEVVLVSMHLPDAEALVPLLLERQARVVAIGRCDNPAVVAVEDGSVHDLIAAIHAAMHGALPGLAGATTPIHLDHLTTTERVVLQAVNDGLSNKEIARDLGVSVPTVKSHVHSLLGKLGVHRRGEAAAIFRQSPAPPVRAFAGRRAIRPDYLHRA